VEQKESHEANRKPVGDRVFKKRTGLLQTPEKRVMAFHAWVTPSLAPDARVAARWQISIVPRGMSALGYTLNVAPEDGFLQHPRKELEGPDFATARLARGRSAEETCLVKSPPAPPTDLQRATDIRRTDGRDLTDERTTLGTLALGQTGWQSLFLAAAPTPRRSVSDATAQAIDKVVARLVESGPIDRAPHDHWHDNRSHAR